MAEDEKCIFCQIISGKIKSRKVYEDDTVLAILDINPATRGHVLLLPKKHAAILPQLSESDIAKFFIAAKGISKTLLKAFKSQGTNIFVANGAVAGQRAPHFMAHIIPRHEGDGLNLVPPESKMAPQDLQAVHVRLMQKAGEKR
jgi:histidine triad (HIT) family protein